MRTGARPKILHRHTNVLDEAHMANEFNAVPDASILPYFAAGNYVLCHAETGLSGYNTGGVALTGWFEST